MQSLAIVDSLEGESPFSERSSMKKIQACLLCGEPLEYLQKLSKCAAWIAGKAFLATLGARPGISSAIIAIAGAGWSKLPVSA